MTAKEILSKTPDVLDYDAIVHGLDYLRDTAPSVDIFLSRHDLSEDLGADHEFEKTVRSGNYDIAAIESTWWTEEVQRKIDDYMQGGSLTDLLDKVDSFSLRLLMSLRGSVSHTVIADVPSPAESALGNEMKKKRLEVASPSTESEEIVVRQFGEYQNEREWVALGVLGNKVAALEKDETSEKPLRILVCFGRGHEGFKDKLDSMGVEAEIINNGIPTRITQRIIDVIKSLNGVSES